MQFVFYAIKFQEIYMSVSLAFLTFMFQMILFEYVYTEIMHFRMDQVKLLEDSF